MLEIDIQQAPGQLSKLMDRVEEGEEIVITRQGAPAARLVPERCKGFAALAGAWRGKVKIADDFDELPNDLAKTLGTQSKLII